MSGLVKAGLVIAVGLFLGRVAGFFREAMIASAFGVSGDADIAILLLTIPDLLVNVLVGGALTAALIPEFKRLGQPRAAGLFVQASLLTGVVFAILALAVSQFSGYLVFAFAPGLAVGQLSRVADLVALTLWLIPLTTLAGVSLAYLHAHNRFGVASFGTFIYNLVVIAGLVLISTSQSGLRLLCAFVILGGILRWGSQLLVLPRPLPMATALAHRLVDRKLIVRYFQAASTGGLFLLLPVIARALASYNGEGAIASFSYALKLSEFALGVSITVLSVAIFPRLSESFAARDEARFGQLLSDGLWWVVVLALSTTVPLVWFCNDFVELAYGWGRMTNPVLETVSSLMMIGLVSLPFQGISSLLTAAFNARGDTRGPLLANLMGLLVFLPLGGWLQAHLGLAGIMISLVMTYALVLVMQIVMLKRHHGLSVNDILLAPRTLLAAGLVLFVCSTVGWFASAQLESALLGVLMAGLSAGLGLVACLGTEPRYRRLLLARFTHE